MPPPRIRRVYTRAFLTLMLPVATFLGPQEKASFASALSAALGEARRGPTQTVLH